MKDDKKTRNPIKKKIGRPSKYTDKLVTEICVRISSGESLLKITKDSHMPNISNVFEWLIKYPEFRDKYTCARDIQADVIFEKVREVCENTEEGETTETKLIEGFEVESKKSKGDMIAHRRLKVDTYKWMLGKMSPKKYGEHIEVAHSGNIDTTMRIVTKDDVDEDDIGFVES